MNSSEIYFRFAKTGQERYVDLKKFNSQVALRYTMCKVYVTHGHATFTEIDPNFAFI